VASDRVAYARIGERAQLRLAFRQVHRRIALVRIAGMTSIAATVALGAGAAVSPAPRRRWAQHRLLEGAWPSDGAGWPAGPRSKRPQLERGQASAGPTGEGGWQRLLERRRNARRRSPCLAAWTRAGRRPTPRANRPETVPKTRSPRGTAAATRSRSRPGAARSR
jgi:hypothetical protein